MNFLVVCSAEDAQVQILSYAVECHGRLKAMKTNATTVPLGVEARTAEDHERIACQLVHHMHKIALLRNKNNTKTATEVNHRREQIWKLPRGWNQKTIQTLPCGQTASKSSPYSNLYKRDYYTNRRLNTTPLCTLNRLRCPTLYLFGINSILCWSLSTVEYLLKHKTYTNNKRATVRNTKQEIHKDMPSRRSSEDKKGNHTVCQTNEIPIWSSMLHQKTAIHNQQAHLTLLQLRLSQGSARRRVATFSPGRKKQIWAKEEQRKTHGWIA